MQLSCLALLLAETAFSGVAAFGVSRNDNTVGESWSSSSRYFELNLVAPPLERIQGSLVEFDPHQPLDIVYTNNPRTAAQWLADNVPSHGCTLGFDTEVSIVFSL
jgi:hypothetical protein